MMKFIRLEVVIITVLAIAACTNEEAGDGPIIAGDFPVKEYALERDPNVNVWGAGIDFIHAETALAESTLDYKYLSETDTYTSDVKFYVVKAYYTTSAGETAAEGCPAILLSSSTLGCKIGEGVAFFDSCSVITVEMQSKLAAEPVIDYAACKNTDGIYSRELLFAALDKCLIGQRFRSGSLVVPDGKTEKEVQPVYLLKTTENGYVKFMVKQFKGDKPNEKQTIVRWQVISE